MQLRSRVEKRGQSSPPYLRLSPPARCRFLLRILLTMRRRVRSSFVWWQFAGLCFLALAQAFQVSWSSPSEGQSYGPGDSIVGTWSVVVGNWGLVKLKMGFAHDAREYLGRLARKLYLLRLGSAFWGKTRRQERKRITTLIRTAVIVEEQFGRK